MGRNLRVRIQFKEIAPFSYLFGLFRTRGPNAPVETLLTEHVTAVSDKKAIEVFQEILSNRYGLDFEIKGYNR